MKSLIAGVVLSALVTPAFANEYWVEYDYSAKQCSIVEKKSDHDTAGQKGVAAPASEPVPSATPPAGSMPTMLPGSAAPAPTTRIVTQPSAPAAGSSATASGSPSTSQGAPTATNPAENKNDPFAVTTSAWARKKAAAEAAGTADIQTKLIGTPRHSREDAEAEMGIMRMCGIAN